MFACMHCQYLTEIFQFGLDVGCLSLIVMTERREWKTADYSLRGQSQQTRELGVRSISDSPCGFGAFTFEFLFLKLSNYLI